MLQKTKYVFLGIFITVLGLWGLAVTIPNTFSSGEVVSAAKMNQNFQALKTAVDTLEAEVAALKAANAPATKSGQLGYAWVQADGTVDDAYAFMTNGDVPTAAKIATGVYKVTFPGFDLDGGHVQVSTYLFDPPHQDNICSVDAWLGQDVFILCVDQDGGAGTPQDTAFTIFVLK